MIQTPWVRILEPVIFFNENLWFLFVLVVTLSTRKDI